MFASFIKRCLFTDLYQTRVGRRDDKIMSTEGRSVDMIFRGLTIHFVSMSLLLAVASEIRR